MGMTVDEVRQAFILAGDRNITFLLDNNFTACSRSEDTVMYLDETNNNLIYIRPGITSNPLVPMEFMTVGLENLQGYRIEMTIEAAIHYVETQTLEPCVGLKDDLVTMLRKSSVNANKAFEPYTALPKRTGQEEVADVKVRLVNERASIEDYEVIKH